MSMKSKVHKKVSWSCDDFELIKEQSRCLLVLDKYKPTVIVARKLHVQHSLAFVESS